MKTKNLIFICTLVILLSNCFQTKRINEDNLAQQNEDSIYTDLKEAVKHATNVRHLSLINLELITFPLEILELKNLKTLDLSFSTLDELPDEIATLSQLERIDVQHSGLKHIPKSIGKLEKLQVLCFLNCEIETIPNEIGHLKNLYYLNLGNNPIESLNTQTLCKLAKLETFYINDSQGIGCIKESEILILKKCIPNCHIYWH
ncbi:MAG: hypothetical protein K1X92_18110 [Bacteroidia bacterium]|nr:hypothetical protein [Bacteroidia bacterium]